ncbi:MAG: heparan-alpha-glucosaminide N-acetyltransferase domain-containing protein [Pirellula sp.]
MRYSSIDCLKTIAIVVMVLVHFAENLSGVQLPITGLGAPLFTFLSGLSYRLWVNGLEAKGTSEEEISKRSIRRGLFVFAVGFAFNIFVWLPEDTFNWDVLTMIGFAVLVLNGLRRLPVVISIFLAFGIIFISPMLRGMADYEAYWVNNYFEVDLTLPDVLIGFLVTGFIPIFPWISYSIAGLVTGTILFREQSDGSSSKSVDADSGWDAFVSKLNSKGWLPVLTGGALIGFSGALLAVRPYLPKVLSTHFLEGWHMFPPTIEYVMATIGMASLLFGLTHIWIDRNRTRFFTDGMLDITKTFSQYSFTIYVVHHMVHLWPLWIYGYIMEHEKYYWQEAMGLGWSLPLAVLFLVVCYFVLRRIGPDRRLGIEGWMRWLCD